MLSYITDYIVLRSSIWAAQSCRSVNSVNRRQLVTAELTFAGVTKMYWPYIIFLTLGQRKDMRWPNVCQDE